VYPDTLAWTNDFPFSFNDPMANMYYWHPAYDDYPVVGVNYYQAVSYCKWLELKLNKEAKNQAVYYEVRLPNAVEWEWVTAQVEGHYHEGLADMNWKSDLSFTYLNKAELAVAPEKRKQAYNYIELDKRIEYKHPYSLMADGAFHTTRTYSPIRSEVRKNLELENYSTTVDRTLTIKALGGNVSEWLDNSYAQWKVAFDARQELLATEGTKSATLMAAIEQYHNDEVDTTGMLVVGANWWDERYSFRYGVNAAGIKAKTFLDPYKSHCTVGFRYVVVPHNKAEYTQE